MELRAFAKELLEADSLAGKLALPPAELSDEVPGPAERVAAPRRPASLSIPPARPVKVPPPGGMADRAQRVRILHAMANHELQAAELFAWALLAFPDAPRAFRRGLVAILADEQRHCQLYVERLRAHGADFGELPVTAHFWNRIEAVKTPLDFVCTMGLTFENANLDFAGDFASAAREAGDHETAEVLDVVHRDEIRHVRFAWRWLLRLAPADRSPWQAYCDAIAWPLGPERARGKHFDADSRRAAGLDEEFIAALDEVTAKGPGGAPRS